MATETLLLAIGYWNVTKNTDEFGQGDIKGRINLDSKQSIESERKQPESINVTVVKFVQCKYSCFRILSIYIQYFWDFNNVINNCSLFYR